MMQHTHIQTYFKDKVFPEMGKMYEIECLSGRKYLTKFLSEFEMFHVIIKWKIIKFTKYEEKNKNDSHIDESIG